jgi:hypothetical protein
MLELNSRVARTLDDITEAADPAVDDPDGPPRHPGRSAARGRNDQSQNHDRKRFRDHDGPLLSDLAPETVRTSYNLLCHLCHSCNIPLLPLDCIVANTTDLYPPTLAATERQQHSLDLYFKLASPGVLPGGNTHTFAWITMFGIQADGYGLLYQLCRHAIPALSMTIPCFPTWAEYPTSTSLPPPPWTSSKWTEAKVTENRPGPNPNSTCPQSETPDSKRRSDSCGTAYSSATTNTLSLRSSICVHYRPLYDRWIQSSSGPPTMIPLAGSVDLLDECPHTQGQHCRWWNSTTHPGTTFADTGSLGRPHPRASTAAARIRHPSGGCSSHVAYVGCDLLDECPHSQG